MNHQYKHSREAKNQSVAFAALVVIGTVVAAGLLLLGWVWLVTFAVNYVLAALGLKPVGMVLVFVCMFLLSCVGRYFKSGKVSQ